MRINKMVTKGMLHMLQYGLNVWIVLCEVDLNLTKGIKLPILVRDVKDIRVSLLFVLYSYSQSQYCNKSHSVHWLFTANTGYPCTVWKPRPAVMATLYYFFNDRSLVLCLRKYVLHYWRLTLMYSLLKDSGKMSGKKIKWKIKTP